MTKHFSLSLLLSLMASACSSAPPGPIHSSAIVSASVHVTLASAIGSTTPDGQLEIAGACPAACMVSVNWSNLSVANFNFGGHTVEAATLALDHWVAASRFADGTFMANPYEVSATLDWKLDGTHVTQSLGATAPLTGTMDPTTSIPSTVTGDLQSTDGSLLVHLLLQSK
jgi:hypothetical protein